MYIHLLSGGLDSALNLALTAQESRARLAITIRYGQRAADAECSAARKLCEFYNVPWRELSLEWLGEINTTGLTRPDQKLPQLSTAELDNMQSSSDSMKAVWVANRNGVLLNIAASFAEALGVSHVVAGFNREEAATFPDNSPEYMEALNTSFFYSTQNHVRVESFTRDMMKTEIMAKALEIKLPLDLVWSCYEKGPARCWTCESCKRTERALLGNGNIGKEWLTRMGWRG